MERLSQELYTPVYDENTIERLKNEFSRLHDEHYLDHAGATLYSDTQLKKVSNDMLTSLYANPHSGGTAGNLTHEIIERTRYRLLDHFHASPDEYNLVFTSGATAALKTVAETFKFQKRRKSLGQESGNFVYMQDNHTSVLGMRDLVGQSGAKVLCLNHVKALKIFSENLQSEIAAKNMENNTNSLFVYSAQCNFTGVKYPLRWIEDVHNGILDRVTGKNSGHWYVLLDAANFSGTNDLDLSVIKPDFVCLSFYKMFGYPTGTGALLVRKSSAHVLDKVYYGGGTVNLALSLENFHIKRDVFHERFEDGTLPFLSIISLQHGLDAMSMVPLKSVTKHVFSLARYLHHSLMALHHSNDNPVAKLYSDTDYNDVNLQGGIVAFNLLRSNGEYVGYTEVSHMAALFKIHLRTGCFCNPGTCQRHLGLSNQDIMQNYDAGYTCGGSRDLIDGNPTGAVRISFGYMSTFEDAEAVLGMIRKCFIDGPEIFKVSNSSFNFRATAINEKYYRNGELTEKKCVDNHNNIIANNIILNVTQSEVKKNDRSCKIVENNGKFMLARLFIYPIKSCAAYEITDSWILGERGLQYDREWMIVTSAGICLSQKQQVNLCMLRPIVCRKTNTLTLNYPGMPPAQVRLDLTSEDIVKAELCRSRVCGHRVEGIDCGSEISEWLSLALGRPNLRLIRQNNMKNGIKDPSKPELSFSSQAQYLLVNEGSIKWIMDKLSEDSDCSRETILYRFRGNMILRGSVPFQETTWSQVQIGKNIFNVNGPCTRCQMVCIDQTTGKKTVEPLRMLAEEFHGKMRFGIYLTRQMNKPATIKIGDPIVCR